ncbi:MAG: BatA domain-containing protein [Emticicia sp.]|nr:BatA domain-containing protein [Emticicia sp.]
MEFINPLMLWGSLAISIPIIIHFWHQKKGRLIEWAATQWLVEKDLQQSRGIRLDNILLLILRCLLLLTLCFFLSKPILKWLNNNKTVKKIHLIQPNKLVTENYKFEIEEALKKGEKCYWIDSKNQPIQNLNQLPNQGIFDANLLQNSINNISQNIDNEIVELYFINNQKLNQFPHIFVPTAFHTHTVLDSSSRQNQDFIIFSGNKRLLVNEKNELVNQAISNKNGKAKHTGAIKVLIQNNDVIEAQNIKAALKALNEVYQFEFQIDEKVTANKLYDVEFSNKIIPENRNSNTLYIFSNTAQSKNQNLGEKNVIFVPNQLKPQTSELVFNGNLPEFLGEQFIKHFGLQNQNQPLSKKQIDALFKIQEYPKQASNAWFSKSILLFFILLLAAERWLAIHKNA